LTKSIKVRILIKISYSDGKKCPKLGEWSEVQVMVAVVLGELVAQEYPKTQPIQCRSLGYYLNHSVCPLPEGL